MLVDGSTTNHFKYFKPSSNNYCMLKVAPYRLHLMPQNPHNLGTTVGFPVQSPLAAQLELDASFSIMQFSGFALRLVDYSKA